MLRLSLGEQILFFNQMTTMLAAGIPIIKALESIGTNAPSGRVRRYSHMLKEHIAQGETISDVMEKLPGIPDSFIINIIRVGEQTGFLDARFREIAQFLEKINSFRMQFLTHLIYPVIIFHAAILLPPLFYIFTGKVMLYVICTLSVLIPVYGAVILGYLMHIALRDIKELKYCIDWILAIIPIISGIVRKLAVTRFTRALGSLQDAGVGLQHSIKIASSACGNAALAERLIKMVPMIDKGKTLADSMRETRLFPSMALQLVATGEDTGDTASLLKKTTEYLDEQLEVTLKRVFIILPLLLYVICGIYVGFIFITAFLRIVEGLALPF